GIEQKIREIFKRFSGVERRFNLASKGYLASVLEPHPGQQRDGSERLTVLRQPLKTVTHLPAWACPDLSAALPCGEWYPVAGARLHPCGGLAVVTPQRNALRLECTTESGEEVNP